MKREKIEKALENIDPIYVEAAANYRKKRTYENKILKWGAMAASLTILLIAVTLLPQLFARSNDVYWSEPLHENGILEKRKLSVISDPLYESYVSLRVIDPAYVGEKLGDTEVRSFWRNYLYGEDTDLELLRAEIYAIKGISTETAVCIRYLDEGDALTTSHYYTYINPNYKPQNFGNFYQTFALDFSAKNRVTLSYPSEEGTVYQYCDIDGNILTRSLTSLTDAEIRAVTVWNGDSALENEKEILRNCSAQALFSGEISPGGTFSCRIYDNGYLYIRINKTISYLFEIHEAATDSVFRMIDEHKTTQNTNANGTVTCESTALPE